jgi:serine/threonine protein kinase
MAPEQISGAPLDPKSDQYAIGVLAFELFAGRLPFDDENVTNLLFRRMYEDPPLLRTFRPEVPEAIEQVVNRMLSKNPDQRFASVLEALAKLDPQAAEDMWKALHATVNEA